MIEDVISDLIEIDLIDHSNFLKIKETLTRIGTLDRGKNALYQTCYILHKEGRYYITHFKELDHLDGGEYLMTERDFARRNTIVMLLEEWNMLEIISFESANLIPSSSRLVFIVKHKDKGNWNLISKYNIGVNTPFYTNNEQEI